MGSRPNVETKLFFINFILNCSSVCETSSEWSGRSSVNIKMIRNSFFIFKKSYIREFIGFSFISSLRIVPGP
jgi:hypothetical protein